MLYYHRDHQSNTVTPKSLLIWITSYSLRTPPPHTLFLNLSQFSTDLYPCIYTSMPPLHLNWQTIPLHWDPSISCLIWWKPQVVFKISACMSVLAVKLTDYTSLVFCTFYLSVFFAIFLSCKELIWIAFVVFPVTYNCVHSHDSVLEVFVNFAN